MARCCGRAGLIRLLEKIPPSPSLLVLTYHRIGRPEESLYDTNLISATPEAFEEQLSYLKSRFHIASLEEVRQLVRRPGAWRHRMVLLTFDDGYLDNYTTAFPILRSHGLEATFFLSTSWVGSRHLPWWDRLAYLIRHAARRRVSFHGLIPAELDLSRDDLEPVIQQAATFCKSPALSSIPLFLDRLAEACGIEAPAEAPERLFLDWSEAEDMLRGGMAIGSHTRSHGLLARLSGAEEDDEVSGSRAVLRHRLGGDVVALAYPVGSPSTFSARTYASLDRAGYELGFSFYGGVNLPSAVQPFNIRRVNIGRDLSFPLFRLWTVLSTIAGGRFRWIASGPSQEPAS
jgi:peptidoglycan/xylan/chitin deacetylase (PgdA/CDA1 family)